MHSASSALKVDVAIDTTLSPAVDRDNACAAWPKADAIIDSVPTKELDMLSVSSAVPAVLVKVSMSCVEGQQVGELTGRIVHLRASTEMVEIQGRQVEMQSVMLQDASRTIRVQLWESQVGVVSFGKTYKFTKLSTREFQGELFLTTTRETTVEAVSSLPGLGAMPRCDVKEDPVVSVSGEVIRAEMTVSLTCGNCKTAQVDFQPKFHRCCKCKMLQKMGMYKPSAIANVTVLGDIGEMNVSANNSVLHRYLVNYGLSHLLQDAQDIEEHFLDCGVLKLHIQNDNVVAIANISEESPSTSEESTSEVSMPAAGEVGSVSATVELQANVESPAMSATIAKMN
ncbi:hypothetical protein ROHU_028415 [Labeo rohita]|uniref:Uncharacterized protein n=1 Tax=Labeo rohita TaxID=84645 RepID=A0A498MCZ5_LABRO|nr:hypothetical protein ROHU_028415 [Labeo rohita]